MSTTAIFEKYGMALADAAADKFKASSDSVLSSDAVLLALRLAIGDAYAAGVETCSGVDDDLAAIVASREKALQAALDQVDELREERNVLQQQLAQMDADNARLISNLHTNGNGANPTTTPDWNRDHPAWSALPAADLGVIDQLSSGQIKFRSISRTLRRDLVLRVFRHLVAVHGEIKIPAFDMQKPAWMPTAGAVVALVESRKWPDLVAMALEPAKA